MQLACLYNTLSCPVFKGTETENSIQPPLTESKVRDLSVISISFCNVFVEET